MMNYATRERFCEVCHRLGVIDETAQRVFLGLTNLYAEQHRKYHNLTHIDRMLGWLDKTGQGADSLELAIWFHDVIYNPLGKDNEAQSADWFVNHLGALISRDLVEDVMRLIMATDATRPRTGNHDEKIIIDIDLSILGSSPEDYDAYRHAIRYEYAAVPELKFIEGRRSILCRFLSQPIYSTNFFKQLELQARVNIQTELEMLDAILKSS